MNYSSVAHLSAQFKKITGLTPSHFKKMKDKRRSPIEVIGNSTGFKKIDYSDSLGNKGVKNKIIGTEYGKKTKIG